MVIYADLLFLINFICNYPTLIILGKAMKLRIRQWRVAAGSALGALGAVLIFCSSQSHAFLKIFPALLMILCAYGFKGRKTLTVSAVFLLITAALSGLVTVFVSLLPTGTNSVIKNGIVYFDISKPLLLVILLAAYPAVCLMSKGLRACKNRKMYLTVIELSERKVTLTALFDSGNTLKEPITGKPVMIAEWDSVKNLFEMPVEFDKLPEKMEEYRLWIIPYHALGKKDGRIFAFLADRIQVDDKFSERVFVGLADKTLPKEYQALLNADLI